MISRRSLREPHTRRTLAYVLVVVVAALGNYGAHRAANQAEDAAKHAQRVAADLQGEIQDRAFDQCASANDGRRGIIDVFEAIVRLATPEGQQPDPRNVAALDEIRRILPIQDCEALAVTPPQGSTSGDKPGG